MHQVETMKFRRQLPNRRIGTIAASAMVGIGAIALINGALARLAERRNPPKGTFIDVDGAGEIH